MRRVKLRVSLANARIKGIAENLRRPAHEVSVVIGDHRAVVDGMGICVVEIKLQVVRQTLPQRRKHRVVGRVAFVCAQGIYEKLRRYADIRWHKSKDTQHSSAEVSLLESGLIDGVDRLRAGGKWRTKYGLVDLRTSRAGSGHYLVFKKGQRSDVCRTDSLAGFLLQGGEITHQAMARRRVDEIDDLRAIGQYEEPAAQAAIVVHF